MLHFQFYFLNHNTASNVNFLMASALRTIAFLPYGALLDLWRWDVFQGNIKPEEYNKKWWEMRLKYQGILPPGDVNESDLDPAAKFHIAWDIPYIRYTCVYTSHKILTLIWFARNPIKICQERHHQYNTVRIYWNPNGSKFIVIVILLVLAFYMRWFNFIITSHRLSSYFSPYKREWFWSL